MARSKAYTYYYVVIVIRSVLLTYKFLLASYPRKFVFERPLSEGVNYKPQDLFHEWPQLMADRGSRNTFQAEEATGMSGNTLGITGNRNLTWLTPVIPAPMKLRQEDHHEFEVSLLAYRVTPCLRRGGEGKKSQCDTGALWFSGQAKGKLDDTKIV